MMMMRVMVMGILPCQGLYLLLLHVQGSSCLLLRLAAAAPPSRSRLSLSRSLRDLLLLLLLPPPPVLRFLGGGAREMQPWQYHLPRGTFSSGGM